MVSALKLWRKQRSHFRAVARVGWPERNMGV